MSDSGRLATRLRALRGQANLLQKDVANALGVTPQQVSNWEHKDAPQLPPVERLEHYALLFAHAGPYKRPVELPREPDLDAEARARRDALSKELLGLRDRIVGDGSARQATEPTPFWAVGDARRIVVIASSLPEPARARLGEMWSRHPDYSESLTYGDSDAVLLVYGALRAANPDNEVVIYRHDEAPKDAFSSHVVVVGGSEVNKFAEWMGQLMGLPLATSDLEGDPDAWWHRRFLVRADSLSKELLDRLPTEGADPQHEDIEGVDYVALRPELEGSVTLSRTSGTEGTQSRIYPRLVRDLALIARQPNPSDSSLTMTLLFGLYARGTAGSSRIFVDTELREANEKFVRTLVDDAGRFWAMFWVSCDRGAPIPLDLTPNLSDPGTVILTSAG